MIESPQPPSDDQLLRMIGFAAPECVDVDGIDQRDLFALAARRDLHDRAASVNDHLQRCAYCRSLLHAYRQGAAPTSRWRWFVPLALAATIVVAFLVMPPAAPTVAYELGAVEGLVAEQMGVRDAPAPVWRVAPRSKIRIVVRPAAAVAVPSNAAAGVFVETPQGIYRQVDADVRSTRDGPSIAYTLQFEGRSLLEGRSVAGRVLVVVATSSEALRDLQGRRRPRPGSRGVLSVVERRFVDGSGTP